MICVDASLNTSRYRYGAYGLFILVVLVLGLASGLLAWQYGVFAILAGLLLWSDNVKPALVHLISPSVHSRDDLWQALIQTPKQKQLWQFYVHSLQDFGACVVLKGYAVEPLPQAVRFVVLSDMMDADNYRKLRALARFTS